MKNIIIFVLVVLAICSTAKGAQDQTNQNETAVNTTTSTSTESMTTVECNPNATHDSNGTAVESNCTKTETPNNDEESTVTSTEPVTSISNIETQTTPNTTMTPSMNTTEQQNQTLTTATMPSTENATSDVTENMTSTTTTIAQNITTAATENATESTTITSTTTSKRTVTLFATNGISPKSTKTATTVATTSESATIQPTTTATTIQTIVEKVKVKWSTAKESLNFSKSSLNQTDVENLSPSEFIDVIVEYYSNANATYIKTKIEDSKVGELAEDILSTNPTLLESEIRDQFNSSQNSSLHGLFATFHWLHDMVLDDEAYFQTLAETFAPLAPSSGDEGSNATATKFINFILSQSNESSLLTSICKVAEAENTDENICPTEPPPTDPPTSLPGPEKLESTWRDIIAANYTFLSSAQQGELESVTPSNMTTATIAYVNDLTKDEVQSLVDQNITFFVGTTLRSDGKTAEETIGREAADAFGGDTDKEDLFYVYLNFITNFVSDPDQFETFLKAYVDTSSQARNSATCDTSTINAEGIVCQCIRYEAINITLLLEAVCEELQAGSQCLDTVVNNDNDQTPIPQGLSTGEIIGIVLGSVFGFIIILIIIFFVWKRCSKKKSKVNPQIDPDNTDVEMNDRASSHGRNSANGHPVSRNGTDSP